MESTDKPGFGYGRPFGTRVIVKVDEAKETTRGGIIIPENAKERPQFGTVLAIGPKVTEEINEGDRVIFGKSAGTPILIGETTYYVMQERELFMSIDEDEIAKVMDLLEDKKAAEPARLVSISTDKESYSIGENILVNIEAKRGETVDINVYNKKDLVNTWRVKAISDGLSYVIPVTERMVPEARIEIFLKEVKITPTDAPPSLRGELSVEVYAQVNTEA